MTRPTRPISWIKAAQKDVADFPDEVRLRALQALTIAAEGSKSDIAKPLHGFGSGVFEIAFSWRGNAYRVVYAVHLGSDLWSCPCISEEIQNGDQNAS